MVKHTCLNVFDHFVGLALKEFKGKFNDNTIKFVLKMPELLNVLGLKIELLNLLITS